MLLLTVSFRSRLAGRSYNKVCELDDKRSTSGQSALDRRKVVGMSGEYASSRSNTKAVLPGRKRSFILGFERVKTALKTALPAAPLNLTTCLTKIHFDRFARQPS